MNQPLPIDSAGLGDAGMQRQNNEDSWGGPPPGLTREQAARKGYLYIVADGVGGHQGGEIASRMAVQITQQVYYADPNPDIQTSLTAAIEEANRQIYHQGISSASEYGMSTTITAAVVRGNQLVTGNVGDSRVYLVRDGQASQLTMDHTWVEERRQAGILSAEEAANHPQRNVITRSLGGELAVQVDVSSYALAAGDQVLLCTDGLSDLVKAQEMASVVVWSRSPEAAVRQLVSMAKQRGAPDNVTAVVVQVGKGGKPVSAHFTSGNLLALGAVVAAVTLVAGLALGLGRFGIGGGSKLLPLPAPSPSPPPTETPSPAPTPTPIEGPRQLEPDGATFAYGEQVVLSWDFHLQQGQRFRVQLWKITDDGEEEVDLDNEGRTEGFSFQLQNSQLEAGSSYRWSVVVEQEEVGEPGEWKLVAGAEKPPTFHIGPPSTPRPEPTGTPIPVVPVLVAPTQGENQQNPIVFRWRGSLSGSQAYRVIAYHIKSGGQDWVVPSELLTAQEWTTGLPAERFGEWRWTVSVIQEGKVVATSDEWMFWFNPIPVGPGGPSDEEGGPGGRD
jgi:serine/threonine protein phosphatase PrpC